MTLIIAVIGLMFAAACSWGLVNPRHMVGAVVTVWERPSGMGWAIGARIVLGVIFILGADATRFPLVFSILGYAMLVAAVAIPIIGKERLTRVIRWFTDRPDRHVRVWLLLGLAFGLFIFYGAI